MTTMRHVGMQVTAKAEYALRAATALADLATGRLPDMSCLGRAPQG